ncbi:hypothetical protein HYPSUDRAFT_71116 [Hypholoma sublateritium FD-334 SS-4]|uniref:Uncharacterized protein n=1 Tax=Hypholoma sublateritium (strain FD-334 SS-4) TaxID=945553 RepID=A0A0D2KQ62_HYPSF|nr:hypothetical protein HYPSUDRAFT_71116 [Hypholoma sublateritium FD-334 SS-4]
MARLVLGDISPMIVIILFLLLGPARAERHASNIHHRRLRRSVSAPSSALQPIQAERIAERISTPSLNPTLTRLPTTTNIKLISDATSVTAALTQALSRSDTKSPPPSKPLTPAPDFDDPSQTHEVNKPTTLSEGTPPGSQGKSASSTKTRFITSRTGGINLFSTLPLLVPPNGLLPTDLSPKPASHVETSLPNPALTTSESGLTLPTTRVRGPFSTSQHDLQTPNPIPATPTQKMPNGPPTRSRKGDNPHPTKSTQHPKFSIPLLSPIPPLLSDIPSAASSIFDHLPTPHEGQNPHLTKPMSHPAFSVPLLSPIASLVSDGSGAISSVFDHFPTPHEEENSHSTKPTQHPVFSIPLPSPIPSLLSEISGTLSSVFDHFPTPHEGFPPKTLTSDKEESSDQGNHRTDSPLSTTRKSPPPFVPLSSLVSSVLSELSGLPSVIDNPPTPVNTAIRKGSRTSSINSATTSNGVHSGAPDKPIVHTAKSSKPSPNSGTAPTVDSPSRVTILPASHTHHTIHNHHTKSPSSAPLVAEKTPPPETTTAYTISTETPSAGGATHSAYSTLSMTHTTTAPGKPGKKPMGQPTTSKKSKAHPTTGTAEPTNNNLFFFGTQEVHPESVGGVVIGCTVVIYVLIMTIIYVFQRRRYQRERGTWNSPATIVRRKWWSRGRNYGRL